MIAAAREASAAAAPSVAANFGSWTCPQCTLYNQPHTRACGACGAGVPGGTLIFGRPPAGVRFGVELELIMDNARSWTAADVVACLREGGVLCEDASRGYTHAVTPGWKVVPDRSVRGRRPDRDLAFELVSPILRTAPSTLRWFVKRQ